MAVEILTHTTRAAGTVLTASIYNADHLKHVTNASALDTGLDDVNTRVDNILTATSTSSVSIGLGSKTFETQADKPFDVGREVLITSDANPTVNRMFGTVTSYVDTTLTVDVEVAEGSGTHSDWTIGLTGARGPEGAVSSSGSFTTSNIAVFSDTSGDVIEDGGNTIAEVLDRANHTGTQALSTISDSGALAAKDTIATADIDNDAVTLAKLADIATSSILGRITGGTGDPEVLSATQTRTILNVEDGADVTDAANVGSTIDGSTEKTTPVDADTVGLIDSAASNSLKKLSWSNLRDTLKAFFDTVYYIVGGADVAIADGGTGASTKSGARTNLEVPGLNTSNTFTSSLTIERSDDSGGSVLGLILDRESASPAAGDDLIRLDMSGRNDAAGTVVYNRSFGRITDPTSGSESGELKIQTIQGGGTLFRVSLGAGLYMRNATDGDKGNGSVNAQAVYDDGTLLTPYVIEQARDGTVDLEALDAKVPNRIDEEDGSVEVRLHEPARRFLARIGTEYDPLDIDKYAQHWKDKTHLTSLVNPANADDGKVISMGEWVQRLIETVEIQAVHIDKLNQRIKALEEAA